MKITEMGGAQGLLNMLNTANDDRTRKAALKALDALSQSGDQLKSECFCSSVVVLFYFLRASYGCNSLVIYSYNIVLWNHL